jgi:hypothetical protein
MTDDRDHIWIDYTNYRGERAWRHVIPLEIRFTSNEWHPEVQWLLTAFDVAENKNAWRTFAMKDICAWQSAAPAEAVERSERVEELSLEGCKSGSDLPDTDRAAILEALKESQHLLRDINGLFDLGRLRSREHEGSRPLVTKIRASIAKSTAALALLGEG